MMSGPSFDHHQSQQHHSMMMMMKRPWPEKTLKNNHHYQNDDQRFNSAEFYAKLMGRTVPPPTRMARLHGFSDRNKEDDLLMSKMVPQVTVVLEGRSICQRISLDKHLNYHSLAKALRQMFVDENEIANLSDNELDLSNAIPGHVIAYQDFEDDLLLVGDLSYRDFVRVAKRIRIIPVKANSRRRRIEA